MATFTLNELAELVAGQLHGDGDIPITGADTIREAHPGDITLAKDPKFIDELANCRASAALTPSGFHPSGMPHVEVNNVDSAFAKIVLRFRPQHRENRSGVNAAAHVSPTASIGQHVSIYPGAVIGEHAVIESGTTIHSGVQIMAGCRIGMDCVIFPNVVLYENSVVGNRCILHAGTVIGAYGFGYSTVQGKHELSAQLGNVSIGDDVEIGAGTTIDRGTYGSTIIGEGTKIDNLVMIAHNCRIGRHNILCSQVGIAGSTTTGDYVVMGGQAGIRDHIRIGDRVRIGAKAGVMADIPAGGAYVGIPATPEREQMMIQAALMKLPKLKKQLREIERTVEQLERIHSLTAPKTEAA